MGVSSVKGVLHSTECADLVMNESVKFDLVLDSHRLCNDRTTFSTITVQFIGL